MYLTFIHCTCKSEKHKQSFLNPLNAELNLMCHPLALLEAHHILHVSSISDKENYKETFPNKNYK
jgi:hypothetical protein